MFCDSFFNQGKVKIKACAKINLALDVLKKDKKTGYHKIRTIFYEYKKLYDKIEIKKAGKNTIINIKRNIPLGAGLGAFSSDIAAIMKGLNKLWKLNLSEKKLMEIGAKFGKDIPFFIVGGVALGENFGEKITILNPVRGLKIKLKIKSTQYKNKTKKMYKKLSLKLCGKESEKTKKLLHGIEIGNKKMIIENIHNDFETIQGNKPKKSWHLCGAGPSEFKSSLSRSLP